MLKHTADPQLEFLLCLPTKHSQGDSDYTKQGLTLTEIDKDIRDMLSFVILELKK